MNLTGKLYIVATPIGNPKDITLRAIEILNSCNAVICEEMREGTTLLKSISISSKEIIILNEHNEAEMSSEVLTRLFKGENLALISDCGTPVFADPGHYLVRLASQSGVPIIPVPGASSITAALSILDFEIHQFVYGGFLSREPEKRKQELTRLRATGLPVVLMDTPYRLGNLMHDVVTVFGKNQSVTLACDLTLPKEKIFRGTASQISTQALGKKSEFILIVHNTR